MQNGPKNLKFKKTKKGKLKKFEFKTNLLKFGVIGLKTLESGILNLKQIESTVQVISKITKHKSKIWFKTFPFLPVYLKPTGTRMGKGKGKFSHFAARISAGTILLELSGSNKKLLIKSLLYCKFKLPVKTRVSFKNEIWLTKTKNESCYDKPPSSSHRFFL